MEISSVNIGTFFLPQPEFFLLFPMQEKSSGTFFMPEKAGPWSYVDRVMLQGPEFSKSPADKSSDPELAAQLVIPGFGIVPGVPAYPAPSTILKQESYVLISL
jgi:hypothetical protein